MIDHVLADFEIPSEDYRLLVNPTGMFVVGGPMGDAGLTGRKIIVDTYGGMARHGGGAFSGKDPSKVDRSAAYAMRWVAKNIVAAGLARRAEVQVAYAIGKAQPVGVFVQTFGTGVVADEVIQKAVLEVFDLRPAAIIRDLDLLRPIYAQTAAYGHFGRELPDFTWEQHRPGREAQGRCGGLRLQVSPVGRGNLTLSAKHHPTTSGIAETHPVCPCGLDDGSVRPTRNATFAGPWPGRQRRSGLIRRSSMRRAPRAVLALLRYRSPSRSPAPRRPQATRVHRRRRRRARSSSIVVDGLFAARSSTSTRCATSRH